MANLRDFVWSGLRAGMDIDVYPASRWPKVGSGKLLQLEPLNLKFTGEAFGIKGSIEIIMPDTSPRGTCIVKLNNDDEKKCPYAVEGQTLVINHPDTQIRIQDHDSKWTWVHSSKPVGVWGGLWPAGMDMALEDTTGEVK